VNTIITVAEAVKDALNAGSFSMEFTAQRLYQPHFKLADMGTLHVSVVPSGVTEDILDRSRTSQDVVIDVAVQQRLATVTVAEIDALMALVGEIGAAFKFLRLGSAVWTRTENAPIFAQDHLDQWRQFTSLLRFTFRVV